MKRNLRERNIIEILKEYNNKYGVLLEASKLKILLDKNKIGFSEPIAKLFDELCGSHSVFLANKLINHYERRTKSFNVEGNMTPKEIKDFAIGEINNLSVSLLTKIISPIMDYLYVGLDGDNTSLKPDTWSEIIEKQKKWHDDMNVGEGKIKYVENNPILIDFRNEDGEGYYWADLQTKYSPEECERMGHCGRTSKGYLYSLRSYKKLPGGKFKINKSHVTASIGSDGILYQMKGPKNSKPKEEFHQYIEPLFFALGGGGEEDDYLIQGFGTEYAAQQDFKLTDLPNETIKELYRNRPELFNTRSLKQKLAELGITDITPIQTTFTLEIYPENIGSYLEGNTYRTYKYKSQDGKQLTKRVGWYERIIRGDIDFSSNIENNWKEILEWYVDPKNKEKIEKIIDSQIIKQGIEIDKDLTLVEKIMEYDNGKIISELESLADEIDQSDYEQFLYDALETALGKYGNVYEFNDEIIKIQVDLKDFGIDMDDLMEYFDRCDDNPSCVFNELLSEDQIDLPKPDLNWDPDFDKYYYNERLSEILDKSLTETSHQKKIVNLLKEYNDKFGLLVENKNTYWQNKMDDALTMLKTNEGEYNQNVVDNAEYINNIKIVKSETKKDKYLGRPLKLFYVKIDSETPIKDKDLADIYSEIIYILKMDTSFEMGFGLITNNKD